MKIECQNNNVPACKFYHKQGAVLSAVDEYAYYNEPEYRHEIQFIWFLNSENKRFSFVGTVALDRPNIAKRR